MNPLALGPHPWEAPWQLWTCHLDHFGARHAALNLAALAVPFLLDGARRRLAIGLAVLAPLLAMALLPFLEGGSYRGASGLACAAWAWTGVSRVARSPRSLVGWGFLGLLGVKVLVEFLLGPGTGGPGWSVLPAAHGLGAILGLFGGSLAVRFWPEPREAARIHPEVQA